MKLRDVSDTSDVHTLIFSVIDDDDNDDVWCKKKKKVASGTRESFYGRFLNSFWPSFWSCGIFQNVHYEVYCLVLFLIVVHRSIKCFELVSLCCLLIIIVHCFLYSKCLAMFYSA